MKEAPIERAGDYDPDLFSPEELEMMRGAEGVGEGPELRHDAAELQRQYTALARMVSEGGERERQLRALVHDLTILAKANDQQRSYHEQTQNLAPAGPGEQRARAAPPAMPGGGPQPGADPRPQRDLSDGARAMQSAKLQAAASPARELRHLDQQTQDRLAELGATVMPLRALKRTGRRPYLFNGETIATVCGVTPALSFWYELNVHRTVIDTYVSDVRLFHKTPDLPDLFWVEEHDDLEAAVARFERYDPAGDVSVPREMSTRAASTAELALWTARLQLQVDQITQHYRAQSGELLHLLVKL